jgi:hypothetical protein
MSYYKRLWDISMAAHEAHVSPYQQGMLVVQEALRSVASGQCTEEEERAVLAEDVLRVLGLPKEMP